MNLFIDIDGVLLGKATHSHEAQLANHAEYFLEFCLNHFDCYWLTTHCRGSIGTVIDYLRPHANEGVLKLIRRVQTTNFCTFKTEALFGDFIWIDDQPTAYELQVLDEKGWLDRWYEVNTRKDMDELFKLIPLLESRRKLMTES